MPSITKQEAIQSIVDSDKVFLTPADVAPILGMDPHSIRLIARQRPELLNHCASSSRPYLYVLGSCSACRRSGPSLLLVLWRYAVFPAIYHGWRACLPGH